MAPHIPQTPHIQIFPDFHGFSLGYRFVFGLFWLFFEWKIKVQMPPPPDSPDPKSICFLAFPRFSIGSRHFVCLFGAFFESNFWIKISPQTSQTPNLDFPGFSRISIGHLHFIDFLLYCWNKICNANWSPHFPGTKSIFLRFPVRKSIFFCFFVCYSLNNIYNKNASPDSRPRIWIFFDFLRFSLGNRYSFSPIELFFEWNLHAQNPDFLRYS